MSALKSFVPLDTSVSTKSIIITVFVLKAGRETTVKEVSIIVHQSRVIIMETVLSLQRLIRVFVRMVSPEEIVK